MSPGLLAWEREFGREPLGLALSGGEDYELCVAGDPEGISAAFKEGLSNGTRRILPSGAS